MFPDHFNSGFYFLGIVKVWCRPFAEKAACGVMDKVAKRPRGPRFGQQLSTVLDVGFLSIMHGIKELLRGLICVLRAALVPHISCWIEKNIFFSTWIRKSMQFNISGSI